MGQKSDNGEVVAARDPSSEMSVAEASRQRRREEQQEEKLLYEKKWSTQQRQRDDKEERRRRDWEMRSQQFATFSFPQDDEERQQAETDAARSKKEQKDVGS